MTSPPFLQKYVNQAKAIIPMWRIQKRANELAVEQDNPKGRGEECGNYLFQAAVELLGEYFDLNENEE